MTTKRSQPRERTHVNLPRRGIFLAADLNASEIPWQRPREADRRPPALVGEDFLFNCFLCDEPLSEIRNTSNEDTHEHVFPQWLQDYFDIRNHRTVAQDPDSRTYDEFKIPACARCNNTYLSQFETRMKNALLGGFDRFKQLRKSDIFLWCGKIYYGLIHGDVLPRDPYTRTPLDPVLPEDLLKDIEFLKLLLQGIRKRVIILESPYEPYSVLLFRLCSGRDPGYYFRVRQATPLPGIGLQLGSIGIIVIGDDYGESELWFSEIFGNNLAGKTLHPVQFWELVGRVLYRSYKCPVATSYSLVSGPQDMTLWLAPRPDEVLEFKPEEEASWISEFTKEPGEVFLGPDKKARTLLIKPDGTFNDLEFHDESQ